MPARAEVKLMYSTAGTAFPHAALSLVGLVIGLRRAIERPSGSVKMEKLPRCHVVFAFDEDVSPGLTGSRCSRYLMLSLVLAPSPAQKR